MDENMEKQEVPEKSEQMDGNDTAKNPNLAETLVKNGLTKEELEDVLKKTFPQPEKDVEDIINDYIASLRKRMV